MTLRPPQVLLVIEDAANIVSVIRQSLRGMLVEVISAADGESGLQLARQLKPDLILLDLALPEISGFEVLEQLRADPKGPSIPVAVVTAHGDSATAVAAREAGATEFLAKPFHPSELRRMVKRLLDAAVPRSA